METLTYQFVLNYGFKAFNNKLPIPTLFLLLKKSNDLNKLEVTVSIALSELEVLTLAPVFL